MARTETFTGFPRKTLTFLRSLRANNTKKWFDAHRSDYEEFYVAPAKAFVSAVGPRLAKLVPGIVAKPRINGSIFRINRDTRFSKDKSPYKDHLSLRFWEGERNTSASAFFLRISPDELCVGAGCPGSSPAQLKAFREAVADPKTGKSLADIAAKLRKEGCALGGEHYKRIPRGFPDDGPASEFLLYNALYVAMEEKKPGDACAADFIDNCLRRWRPLVPLHRWLMDHVR